MEVPLAAVEDGVSDGEGDREEAVSPYGLDSMLLPDDRLRDMLQVRRGSVASTRSRGAGKSRPGPGGPGYNLQPVREGGTSPQQGDLRLSGPPSGQGAGSGARTRDRKVPADLRADSLATVPPTPLCLLH
ncbi:hypothetical protein PoB_006466100 [Plakobranchus ocellatus]|uniref:Uncharacterized protein n=1 Tax=Plakobranchus ocellatus TaxID=259542 RepID=A0AAV4D1T9_9GAST|nr:hypothetical protein PoB_006466100 [Plakobranchus ocellatus]